VPAALDLRAYVREIPDFPRPGIQFKDMTPLLLDPQALRGAVAALAEIAASLGFTAPSVDGMHAEFDPGRLPREPWTYQPR